MNIIWKMNGSLEPNTVAIQPQRNGVSLKQNWAIVSWYNYLLTVSVSSLQPLMWYSTVTLKQSQFQFPSFLMYSSICIQPPIQPGMGEGNGTPLQYCCPENPMDGGAWQAAVHGVAKSQTRLSDFIFTFHFHALEKEMATHSSVLAWRIPWTEKPGRLQSMGSHRVGHD